MFGVVIMILVLATNRTGLEIELVSSCRSWIYNRKRCRPGRSPEKLLVEPYPS